jgi:hypothetical protein
MTSKVVRESQKISNFSGEKPLKTLESVSTPVQPLQTPYSRYMEEREEAPPSPPFENGAVVAEGKESSETKIIVSDLLAKQIQRKWRQ